MGIRYQTALMVQAVVIASATLLVARLNPPRATNLAVNAVVTTSSRARRSANPEGVVDGGIWLVGFQTRKEDEPWVMLDLVTERLVSRVVVYNRMDCCFEHAAPLELEVSRNGRDFASVAQQLAPFGVWDQKFAPTQARFIRLRLLRRDYFHLTEIEVYR
jgi:F5/8 type C domain